MMRLQPNSALASLAHGGDQYESMDRLCRSAAYVRISRRKSPGVLPIPNQAAAQAVAERQRLCGLYPQLVHDIQLAAIGQTSAQAFCGQRVLSCAVSLTGKCCTSTSPSHFHTSTRSTRVIKESRTTNHESLGLRIYFYTAWSNIIRLFDLGCRRKAEADERCE